MLTISRTNGISRRDVLTVGTLGLGGLTLGDLLRLEAQGAANVKRSRKAVIQIFLRGGPSHIDMYDMKPAAPVEFRGEFKPIQTNVPGIDMCELMPLQAKIMDKLAIVRNMCFGPVHHDIPHFWSGFPYEVVEGRGVGLRRPDFGSVISRLSNNGSGIPPFVGIGNRDYFSSAYLGPAHTPLPVGSNLDSHPATKNLALNPSVTVDRLTDRKELLLALDTMQRDLDSQGNVAGVDIFNAKALDIISSNKVRDAFDISKEPKQVRDKFGPWRSFLQARRLVEAGVQVVTLTHGEWDTHNSNFKALRKLLPEIDQIVYALVTDLHERGLDKDVLVVVGGEMGRMPRIAHQAAGSSGASADGRDHWLHAGFMLMAGGGFRMGQAIGNTGPRGERDAMKRYSLQNMYATLYHLFGIDPSRTLSDQKGRPHFVLEDRGKIDELL
jgi:uncharacterized protein (DUF1501 family)